MFNYHTMSTAAGPALLNKSLGTSFAVVPTQYQLAYTSLPGSTGHIVLIIMALMYGAAVKKVRGPYFNVFWFSHHVRDEKRGNIEEKKERA
jgi:NADPH oxidase